MIEPNIDELLRIFCEWNENIDKYPDGMDDQQVIQEILNNQGLLFRAVMALCGIIAEEED
jgi:hypothetical protein